MNNCWVPRKLFEHIAIRQVLMQWNKHVWCFTSSNQIPTEYAAETLKYPLSYTGFL